MIFREICKVLLIYIILVNQNEYVKSTEDGQTGSLPKSGTPGTQQPPTQTTPAGSQSQNGGQGQDSTKVDSTSGDKKRKPTEVNIRSKDSTNLLDCVIDEKSKTRTYTAKDSYAFEKVFQKKGSCNCCGSDNVVYEPTQKSDFAIQVVVFNTGQSDKQAKICLVNGSTKDFYKEKDGLFSKNKPWKEGVPITDESRSEEKDSEGNVLLNLDYDNDKKSNDKYEYEEKDGKRTYKAKDGYKFKSLKIKGIKLWESDGKTYATTLEVSYSNEEKKYHTKADLGGKNYAYATIDPDELKTQSQQEKYTVDKSKVKLYTKNDQDQLVELTVDTNFKVKDEYDGATKYDLLPNSNCVEVKYNNESIWKIDSAKHGSSYPINLYFLADGKLKVALNSQFDEKDVTHLLELRYEDEEDDLSRDLIKLDIDKKDTTNHIEYSKDNNIETYTAKGKFLIKTVKRGSVLIWRSYNDSYPNKLTVTQKSDGKYEMKLTYGDVTTPISDKESA